MDGEGAAAQAGIDRARIDDPARSLTVVGGVEHRIGPDLVDRQVRTQRQNGDAVRVIIVEIVVAVAVTDVQGRVINRLAAFGINIRALSGEVDRAGARAIDARQRQPIRDVDIRARRRQVHRAIIGHARQRAASQDDCSAVRDDCPARKGTH